MLLGIYLIYHAALKLIIEAITKGNATMNVTGILAEKGFRVFQTEPKTHQGTKIIRIWFVVDDHQQAYIYRKTPHGLELLAHATADGKQIKSVDDHIFSSQSLNTHNHKNASSHEPHHSEMAFIRRLTEWLNVAENEKSFDHLVLIAPPQTLGNIRASLSKHLTARVWRELDKDLTGMSLHELQERLYNL
jgi:protein required for attachment to host cells